MEPVTLLDTRIYAVRIYADTLRTRRRDAERHAVGMLVRRAFGDGVSLCHHADGAPYIAGYDGYVSVTHARDIALLAVCDTHRVGIDADYQRQALTRVAPRFLSDGELSVCDGSLCALAAAWTLKEAMFKAMSHLWPAHSHTLADIPLPDDFVPPVLTAGSLVVALYRDDGRYVVTERFSAADL